MNTQQSKRPSATAWIWFGLFVVSLALVIPLGIATGWVAWILWAIMWIAIIGGIAKYRAQREEEASGKPQLTRRYNNQSAYETDANRLLGLGYVVHSTSPFRSGNSVHLSVVYRKAQKPDVTVNQNVTVRHEPPPMVRCRYCSSTVPVAASCSHCGAPLG